MLADGEEVISNRRGQADMNRAALKAGNAGARLAVVSPTAALTKPAPTFTVYRNERTQTAYHATNNYAATAGASERASVVPTRVERSTHQVVERLPSGPVRLVVDDGRELTAHFVGVARDVARDEIDADGRFRHDQTSGVQHG